jgi:hypothetical protein
MKKYLYNNILPTVSSLCLIIFVLIFYGLIPLGSPNTLAIFLPRIGLTNCFDLKSFSCPNIGIGTNFIEYQSVPFALIYSLLKSKYLTPEIYWSLFTIFLVIIAFIFSFKIAKSLRINKYLSIIFAFSYLLSLQVASKVGYVYLFHSAMMLPVSIFLDLRILNKLNYSNVFLSLLFKLVFIFTDAYIFFISFLFSIAVFIAHPKITKKIKVFCILLGGIFSFFFQKSAWRSPYEFFVGQGIDLKHLLIRTSISKDYKLAYSSDGESIANAFLGYQFIIVLVLILLFFRKIRSLKLKIIIFTILFSLLLSMGPNLKIDSKREITQVENINFNSYLHPQENTISKLPHFFIYENFFPFHQMRSVSRWTIITVFFSNLIFFFFLNHFIKIKFYLILLLYVPFINMNLDIIKKNKINNEISNQYKNLKRELFLSSGENIFYEKKVLFTVYKNEYFSTFFCSFMHCLTPMKSGDKNLAKLIKANSIIEFSKLKENNYLSDLLTNEVVDLIFVPHFDLRWDTYAWPNLKKPKISQDDLNKIEFFKSKNYKINKFNFYTVISLR